jgi:hypothetical protein
MLSVFLFLLSYINSSLLNCLCFLNKIVSSSVEMPTATDSLGRERRRNHHRAQQLPGRHRCIRDVRQVLLWHHCYHQCSQHCTGPMCCCLSWYSIFIFHVKLYSRILNRDLGMIKFILSAFVVYSLHLYVTSFDFFYFNTKSDSRPIACYFKKLGRR